MVLSDLSAVVVSGGHKGENLIKDYDQVKFPADDAFFFAGVAVILPCDVEPVAYMFGVLL